jgi:hypothetical protein
MKETKSNPKQIFFDQNPEYLKYLKELPYGSTALIRARLILKFGESHNFTLSYVRMVLDINDPRMNRAIINEAVSYVTEIRLENERILNLLTEGKTLPV